MMSTVFMDGSVTSFIHMLAEEGGGDGILSISWIMPAVSVLVILTWILLDRIYFRPVEKIQKDRFNLTEGRIEEARKLHIEAENLLKKYERRIYETRLACQDIVAERRKKAEERALSMLEAAREETRKMIHDAKASLSTQVEEKKSELSEYAKVLAHEIVERILARPVRVEPGHPPQERRP